MVKWLSKARPGDQRTWIIPTNSPLLLTKSANVMLCSKAAGASNPTVASYIEKLLAYVRQEGQTLQRYKWQEKKDEKEDEVLWWLKF